MKHSEALTIEKIKDLLGKKDKITVAIDGRCGAGKTTLANRLSKEFDCNVIRMDHFFLPADKRTESTYQIPGENFDRERFYESVILNLKKGDSFFYYPYNCKTGEYDLPVAVKDKRLTIVEGSYSCHPMLFDFYDITVFITVDPLVQLERIALRNGRAAVEVFEKKWIPLEEKYFEAFDIQGKCDVVIDGGQDN